MTILIHRLLAEQSRCRQLIGEYRELGSAGAFGTALIEAALARADFASLGVDEAGMRHSLMELQAFEGVKPKPLAFRNPVRRQPGSSLPTPPVTPGFAPNARRRP